MIYSGRGENKMYLKPPPTPLKIIMEPQNEGLEDDFPFQRAVFQVPW